MDLYKIYEDAKVRIQDENNWCRGVLARNADNLPVEYFSPQACQWCLLASLHLSARKFGMEMDSFTHINIEVLSPLMPFARQRGWTSLYALNDALCHQDCLAFLDVGINHAKSKNLQVKILAH